MNDISGTLATWLKALFVAAIPVLGVLWVADVPQFFGYSFVDAYFLSLMAGLAIGAAFLHQPYGKREGLLEMVLALTAFGCWLWGGWHHEDWLIDIANRGAEKWLPGAIGLLLLLEAIRRSCGMAIAVLVTVFAVYGFLGQYLPGPFEAAYTEPKRMVLYLYADTNGVAGLVLSVGATIVLCFIILGAIMGEVGSSGFFTDAAMATMGHRRGGPAKVAVVASSLFGTISGSTVGNIMTTGIVTIPLMKKSGFPSHVAAAVEAVASNGGQLAPPVMGATAFLIAEFLQISYGEVVAAAVIPALVYYLVLFLQVDLIARKRGLHGLPKSELPVISRVLVKGWPYVLPLLVLVYMLFHLGYSPGKSALYAAAMTVVVGLVAQRRWPTFALLRAMVMQSGYSLITLLLICAGAGIVIGVLNITGLGFSMTNILSHVGESGGVLVMLGLTAAIAIVLGMGMPTAAVYIVLSIILAPALVKMGLVEISAHLFIFYFGLLSMLTPPVAVASYAAGGLANASLWATGLAGLRLGASAYLLPFLFCLNPALIGQGTWLEIGIVFITAMVAGYLLAHALVGRDGGGRRLDQFVLYFVAALVVGSATLWTARDSLLALVPAAIALVVIWPRDKPGTPVVKQEADG